MGDTREAEVFPGPSLPLHPWPTARELGQKWEVARSWGPKRRLHNVCRRQGRLLRPEPRPSAHPLRPALGGRPLQVLCVPALSLRRAGEAEEGTEQDRQETGEKVSRSAAR